MLKDSRTLDNEDSLFRFFRLVGSEADAGAVEGFPYVAEHPGLLLHSCLTSTSEGCPWFFTRGLGEVPAVRVLDGPLSSRRADVLFCIQRNLTLRDLSSLPVSDTLLFTHRSPRALTSLYIDASR